MNRREFSKKVRAEIILRSLNPSGYVTCEMCGLVLGRHPYHIDHTIPDGLAIDKSRELTAKDGKLLGVECCHRPKTAEDVAHIARAVRLEAKYLGAKKPQRNPLPGSRASPWKRTMDGRTVRREEP